MGVARHKIMELSFKCNKKRPAIAGRDKIRLKIQALDLTALYQQSSSLLIHRLRDDATAFCAAMPTLLGLRRPDLLARVLISTAPPGTVDSPNQCGFL